LFHPVLPALPMTRNVAVENEKEHIQTIYKTCRIISCTNMGKKINGEVHYSEILRGSLSGSSVRLRAGRPGFNSR
jgi:hypothetical protein